MSSPDANKFWSMARQASSDLHARLNKDKIVKMWPMFAGMIRLDMMSEMTKAESDRSGQRGDKLIYFTNLCHAKFLDRSPGYDDVILRARFGCSAGHSRGTIFGINVVTFNGKLFLTIIYYSNIVNDVTAQKYADLVEETILMAIKDIED